MSFASSILRRLMTMFLGVFLRLHLKKRASQANRVGCICVYQWFAILCWLMVKLRGFALVLKGCVKVIHYLLYLFWWWRHFSRLVNKVIDAGVLEGFRTTDATLENMLISHLLFGDDTFFLGNQMRVIWDTWDAFVVIWSNVWPQSQLS